MRQKRGERLPVEAPTPSCVPAATKPRRKPTTLKDLDVLAAAKRAESEYERTAEMRERAFSNKTLHPAENSAITVRKVLEKGSSYLPDLTPSALVDELAAQCEDVSNGNMRRPEALLMTQAQTLDLIFNDLVQRFYDKVGDLELAERLLRLAFKAQSQSRANVETLGYLKNPPTVFAKQANMTTGPQQVNNNSRTRETEFSQNELLEHADGKRLEPSTSSGAGRRNPEMAALGKVNRSKDR
jgi:hypothetical protein